MLRIETRGTPRQRGQQQGEATRDLALPWIEEGWLKDLSFNVPPSDLFLPSFLSDLCIACS